VHEGKPLENTVVLRTLVGSWVSSVRLCSSPVLDAQMSSRSMTCWIRRSLNSSYQEVGIHLPRLAVTQRRLECTRKQGTPWSDVTEMVAAVSLRCGIEGELALLWRQRPATTPTSLSTDDTAL